MQPPTAMAQPDSDVSMNDDQHPAVPVAPTRRRRASIAEGLQLPSTAMHDTASGDENGDLVSRKRRHKTHEMDPAPQLVTERSPDSSQRSRRSKSSHSRRQVSSPGRLSRFQEGSMNDRASNQPPSVFTRFFPSRGMAPIDQLMEDYHAENDTSPTPRGPSRVPSHGPKRSVSSTTSNANTASTRESGIFRFGRSIAATFNPVNIWQKMQQKWGEARQELIEEALDEQARQLRERALKADEVYAHLKKTGQLGAQGTHAIANGKTIFTPGYTAPSDDHRAQRDSGISGIEPYYARPYEQKDATKSAANVSSPPERKSALHFKTPSFANLKKARSEAQLAKRAPSSPTADTSDAPTPHTLQRSHSKKDMQKQLRLHKRVSDLEAKLQDARVELYQCLGDTPPVPALPAHLASSLNSNKPRVPTPLRKKASATGVLPSLPSERLLFPTQADNREDFLASSPPPMPHTDDEQPAASQVTKPDSPIAATPTATNDLWIADIESAKPRRKINRSIPERKRKSGTEQDSTFKPGPDGNDDAEWEQAAQDEPPKRKRGRPRKTPGPEAEPETKLSKKQPEKQVHRQADKKHERAGKQPVDPVPAKSATETAAKDVEQQPTVHASVDEAIESMVGERVTTAKVMLRDGSPSRPSALATPSHPVARRSTRSASPAQQRQSERSGDKTVYTAHKGRSVPPMPSVPENLRLQTSKAAVTMQHRNSSFEWPDDVF